MAASQTDTDVRSDLDADGRVPDELVASYREDGFVRVRGVLDPDQVERFRSDAEAFLAAHRAESLEKHGVFSQLVNVWQRDQTLRELTFHRRLGRVAEQLAGFPLRLWHDQMLSRSHTTTPPPSSTRTGRTGRMRVTAFRCPRGSLWSMCRRSVAA